MAPAVCAGLFLACAVRSLAERASVIVDDGLSMMQVNHQLSHKLSEHRARAPPLEQVNHQLSHESLEHLARAPRHVEVPYKFQSSLSCEHPILTIDECSSAAAALGMPLTAEDAPHVASVEAPPYCYVLTIPPLDALSDIMKFNDGSNTASCSDTFMCICGTGAPAPTSAPTSAATPAPTPAPTQRPYSMQSTGSCTYNLQTVDECTSAADAIGFAGLTAVSDGLVGDPSQPAYCYIDVTTYTLKFNDGSNTGSCTNPLYCICATSGPAGPPTGSPTQGAVATGDPHVTNVDGERFDITRSGVHEFLRLPRRANQSHGSAEPEPLLSVLAAVERSSEEECHASYVKQVDVTGSWLNSSGPLRFRADGDSLESTRAIVLWVNGSLVDAHALGQYSRLRPFLQATEPRTSHGNSSSTTLQKVPLFTVELSFAAATLRIDWVHRAAPGGPPLNHLNFQALGLRRFLDGGGADIGGILGRDDHSIAASLPEDCKRALEDLRSSGEQGGLQVVAAAL